MRYLFAFCVLSIPLKAFSQKEIPYAKEVKAFEKLDSIEAPPLHPILFIGSSSFTYWKNIKESFPGYPILNRAFGGSTLEDQINHFNKIVPKYHPKQVMIYCGENDLAYNDTLSVKTMVGRFRKLFSMIRESDQAIFVTYVSLKPSPSRKKLLAKYEEGNKLIKEFLAQQKRTSFVDVYPPMMQGDKPIREIFLQDSLHMNSKGYALWIKALKPYLRK
jgi:lysophospholipase L1-like esterase